MDIGAHIGSFSTLLGTLRPDLTIIAVEPAPNNFKLLKENIAENGLQTQVIPLNIAIAARPGTRLLDVSKNTDAYTLAGEQCPGSQAHISVRAETIDECLENVGLPAPWLIKVDIEGSEYEILEGGSRCIMECQSLLIEWHAIIKSEMILDYRWVLKKLTSLGFKSSVHKHNIIVGIR